MNLYKKLTKALEDINENPSGDHNTYKNSEQWEAVPREKREKWGWWYLEPKYFEWEKPNSIWEDHFDDWAKKNYPIQFRFRQILEGEFWPVKWIKSQYGLSRWWYEQISSRLRPRQKWLTDKIERTWQDKTYLIPELLFACIIHFVEEEGAFEKVDWEHNDVFQKVKGEIEKCYNWAKHERPELKKEMDEALDIAHNNKNKELTYQERYGEYDALEKELEIKDKYYSRKIAWLAPYMWV